MIPGWGRSPGKGKKQLPTPVFWPGESHGQRSLMGYSPRGHNESDMTEQLDHPGSVPSGVSLLGHMCALDECPGLGPADPTLPASSPLCCSLSRHSHGALRGACASPRDEAHTLGGPLGLGRESPCVLGDGQPGAIGRWVGGSHWERKGLGARPGLWGHQ